MKGELCIRRYRTRAILGYYPHECTQPREVLVTVILRWAKPPPACQTDDLRDAICYEALLKTVDNVLRERSFFLVEKLTCFLYETIRSFVVSTEKVQGEDISLQVEIIKPNPPIEGVSEVSFLCSDW
ncbi:MAG: dihydroneopterin aldolase [Holosporales bacterium]|jgi:dihydroneopterin aldolase|nr:dihydroneopterin aldolase [Holosporales bacterium]